MTALYIHIPFCAKRCKYCDFFSTTQLAQRQAYTNAVCQEIIARKTEADTISSIYLGGGTPSQLTPAQLQQIHNTIHTHYQVITDAEVTIEANPKDLTEDWLKAVHTIGFNRISIGIQSLNDNILQFLGRRHTAAEAQNAVRRAQTAGFCNISVDLMYGLPYQTIAQLQQDIEAILAMNIQHVSTYCLTYEDGTPLTRMLEQGTIQAIDDDTCNQMYELICNTLKKNNFSHYEVSNFCKDNYHSRHNSAYWNGTPYIGIGAGAHSYDGHHTRRWNCCDMKQYIDHFSFETENLTPNNLWNERIMLALRTANGINIASYNADEQAWLMQQATPWLQQNLLIHKDNHLIATQLGLNILNRITETFLKV